VVSDHVAARECGHLRGRQLLVLLVAETDHIAPRAHEEIVICEPGLLAERAALVANLNLMLEVFHEIPIVLRVDISDPDIIELFILTRNGLRRRGIAQQPAARDLCVECAVIFCEMVLQKRQA